MSISMKCPICGKISRTIKEINQHVHTLSELKRTDFYKDDLK